LSHKRAFLNTVLYLAACYVYGGRLHAAAPSAIRLDDLLPKATIQASTARSNAWAVEPLTWQNFFNSAQLDWQIVRGRMSIRDGDLLVQGEGGTPVLTAPKQPAIDWKLFQAIEIRMSAEGSGEVKIKIGDYEAKRALGPSGQYNVYHFDIDIDAPKGSRALAIMPTNSLRDLVAIHSIKLIPKPANFTKSYGRDFLGKSDEYREAIYIHSPSLMTFPIAVPSGSHLHVGLGSVSRESTVTFRIAIAGTTGELYSKVVADPDQWADADIDLSRWAGKSVSLQLKAESNHDGAIALWSSPTLTAPSQSAPARLNVLIYTIDTLRADHASVYGYARNTTPFLKKLGASGIVFEDCQAQATWTKPSIASLMTSLYSFTHGIIGDADTIPSGATTIAEQLRGAGYVTASIVASPYVGRATGLERGFDYLLESPVILRRHNQVKERDTDSEALNEVVFHWLDQHHEEPFFLYAHSTDPHAPYNPPPPFDSAFAKPAESPEFTRDFLSFRNEKGYGGGMVLSPAMAAKEGINADRFIHQAIDRYDGEIQHNDHGLELLVGKLKQLGVLENTIVIVISDHGEEFFDHGWTAHGHSVYQELTHSVFLMSCPRLFPVARRISEPVQLIDVMPTVLETLSLKAPPLIEGQSLVPLALGRPFERRGLVVSSKFAAPHPMGLVPENQVDSFAIVDSKWKFIYRNKAAKVGIKKVELYDRMADRAELHDLSPQHAKDVEAMIGTLIQWIEAKNKLREIVGHAGRTQLDQQTLNQLRSLGYLGGTSQ
jgi:arylsulfatase A-like enzyme